MSVLLRYQRYSGLVAGAAMEWADRLSHAHKKRAAISVPDRGPLSLQARSPKGKRGSAQPQEMTARGRS